MVRFFTANKFLQVFYLLNIKQVNVMNERPTTPVKPCGGWIQSCYITACEPVSPFSRLAQ